MGTHRELPASICRLIERIESVGVRTPADANAILSQSEIRCGDLSAWADFDHSVADSYGRKLVHRGPTYELMVMSWSPGDFSAIHDHGAAQWGAVLYLGAAEHAEFRLANGQLTTDNRRTMQPGDVNSVDHDLIHQMGNPTDEPFTSVHLYGCHAPCANVTGDARVFDLFEQQIQFTNGGVFFCLPEAEITARASGPQADASTTRAHHTQMLARIERMQARGASTPALDERAAALRLLLGAQHFVATR